MKLTIAIKRYGVLKVRGASAKNSTKVPYILLCKALAARTSRRGDIAEDSEEGDNIAWEPFHVLRDTTRLRSLPKDSA